MAVAGGLTVSAVAGRPLPSATFGRVGESELCEVGILPTLVNFAGISGVIENKMRNICTILFARRSIGLALKLFGCCRWFFA